MAVERKKTSSEAVTLKLSEWFKGKGLDDFRIILTTWDSDTTPFVTHFQLADGLKLSGHYRETIEDALKDFSGRVEEASRWMRRRSA